MSSTAGNPNTPTGNNPYTLGRCFFTGAVLMVDHDAGTFTLWQANPLPDSELVAVLDSKPAAGNCTDGVGGGNAETESQDSGGGNTAAIAGGVVGGIIGLGVIIAGAFLLVRKRTRKGQAEAAAAAATPVAGMEVAQPYKFIHPEPLNQEYALLPVGFSDGSSPGLLSSDGQRGSGYTVYEVPGIDVVDGRGV